MERELVDWLRKTLSGGDALKVGIGDDAAVLSWQDRGDLVVTTDLVVDRVHFDLSSGIDPRRVGRKALAVNLSDLAAMAAKPVGAVVSLLLPKAGGMKLAKALYEGMLPLAAELHCLIVGGDTNSHEGPLVISVTAFGEPAASGVWTRSGAKPGDHLIVTGTLGGSLLGKHLDFTPRVAEALLLAERYDVHAALDLSDGLSLDLARLVKESRCGARLRAQDIPISGNAHTASRESGRAPLDHALSDGEDFELLLAVPPHTAQKLLADEPLEIPITNIGEITSGRALVIVDQYGASRALEPNGYEHTFDA
jgi:thiamine-monophosphate kinase